MTPATLNFSIDRGITFGPLVLRCVDDLGDPVDLTGWTPEAMVRRSPVRSLAFSMSPTLTDAVNGEVSMELTAAFTNTLAAGAYTWDLVLITPGGLRYGPYAAGAVTVNTLNSQP
jgi:hypothetical protein